VKNIKRITVLLITLAVLKTATGSVIITSIPKCGSNLLDKAVALLRKEITTSREEQGERLGLQGYVHLRQGHYRPTLHYHLHYNPHNLNIIKKDNLRLLFIYRDPRDQILSFIPYMKKLRPQVAHEALRTIFRMNTSILQWPDNELKKYLIRQQENCYGLFLPWKDHPNTYAVKFEDLVGPEGGGSREAQVREVINIAKHMGRETSREQALQIALQLFGGTGTFRKGKIGAWKEEFTTEKKELCKKHFGQLLIDLGYEKDFDW